MKREEQKKLREAKKELEGVIKTNSKAYGYKTISGLVYKIVEDFVYMAIIIVPPIDKGTSISVQLSFKPLILDELFWDIFEITEGKKMPKSFHVNGAFTAQFVSLESWKENIQSIEDIGEVYPEILEKMDRIIAKYSSMVYDLSTFKPYVQEKEIYKLDYILTEIQQQRYMEAIEIIDSELSNNKTGIFIDSNGKSFYQYAKEYCHMMIKVRQEV